MTRLNKRLLVLLAAEPSTSIGEVDVKLSCTLHDSFTLKGRHIVCDLSAVLAVVHH